MLDLSLYDYEHPPYRPPSEAYSLLIRATRNCPYNRCEFCAMYKGEKFQIRESEEIKEDINKAKEFVEKLREISWKNGLGGDLKKIASYYGIYWLIKGEVKRVFIGDSDSLIIKTEKLKDLIEFLYKSFPTLERVTSYARAKTILKKTDEELKLLKKAGLTRLHLGLETGDNQLLKFVNKGATKEEMIESGIKVKKSGISLSEYVILGLGGKERWKEHSEQTAEVLNKIDPDFIRVRTLFLLPNTPLYQKYETGEFHLLEPEEILKEERNLIEKLNVNSYFVSDHVTNYLNVEGKISKDKKKMLNLIDSVLSLPEEEKNKILEREVVSL